MAKGDRIDILVRAGEGTHMASLVASKAGRTVRQKIRRSKTDGAWIEVTEHTRNGGATGNLLRVRLDYVLSVEEHNGNDEPPSVRRPRARKMAVETVPLFEDIA